MQRARGQFLARAHWAGDQHAAVGGRDLLQQLAQLAHGVRTAQQLGVGSCSALERLILALQAEGFERAADNQQQPVRLEGFLDVLIGAALDGGDGRFDIAVAGDDDDRHLRVLLLDDIEEIEAVELRSHQPDVEDDQRRPALPRLRTVPRRCCGQAGSRSPSSCRMPAISSRISVSSSTIRMSAAIGNSHHTASSIGHRKPDRRARSHARPLPRRRTEHPRGRGGRHVLP